MPSVRALPQWDILARFRESVPICWQKDVSHPCPATRTKPNSYRIVLSQQREEHFAGGGVARSHVYRADQSTNRPRCHCRCPSRADVFMFVVLTVQAVIVLISMPRLEIISGHRFDNVTMIFCKWFPVECCCGQLPASPFHGDNYERTSNPLRERRISDNYEDSY
jgi:hypothetical protein